MLTVHHLNNSRSQRILWLLEELELDYQIVHYQRHPKTMLAPKELLDVHPLGKSPVITDGDRTIAESGAIIEYLVDAYDDGQLRPERGTPEYDRYRYWIHYAEGSAMTPFLLKLIFGRLPGEVPLPLRPILGLVAKGVGKEYINPQIRLHMNFWEQELAQRPYFVGNEFSAADVQMSFAVEAATARADQSTKYPHVTDLITRLHNRPAYTRALRRGGDYSLAM